MPSGLSILSSKEQAAYEIEEIGQSPWIHFFLNSDTRLVNRCTLVYTSYSIYDNKNIYDNNKKEHNNVLTSVPYTVLPIKKFVLTRS